MAGFDTAVKGYASWIKRPSLMVRELFGVEPDAWQEEVLDAFPHHPRLAMVCCKGPGKTCVLAWLGWHYLLTRPQAKIAATSVSEANLSDNLWPELAKWQQKSPLLQSHFEWTASRVFAKASPETWFLSKRTWSQRADPQAQAATLAGFHADYVLYLVDECGDVPDAVMVSAEAALASGKECHIVVAGNPTRRDGPLYRASTSEKNLWYVVHITGDPDDPKRSSRVSIQYANDEISRYGRENPWVLVNVFGRFPPSSLNALIGPDEMRDAENRSWREHDISHAPRVMGVDVARFGDDASVLFPRQGLVMFSPTMWRNVDSVQGAGSVARKWQDFKADACFVDNTGGYGAGWIDCLRLLGLSPVPVTFSAKATDERYFNKRAEMYFAFAQWIKDGGQLPKCPELVQAMTQTQYTYKGDRLLLEDKEQLKQRIGMSPDHADAAAMTFAQPVGAPQLAGQRRHRAMFRSHYDPMAIRPEEMFH